jgi:hypothetical protein
MLWIEVNFLIKGWRFGRLKKGYIGFITKGKKFDM